MGLQSACLACSGGGKPLVFGSAELPVAGGPVRPAGRRRFARSCTQWCRARLRALSLRCARAFGTFGSGCLMHSCICCRACECESIYATVSTARAQLLVVKVKSIMLYYTCELTRPLNLPFNPDTAALNMSVAGCARSTQDMRGALTNPLHDTRYSAALRVGDYHRSICALHKPFRALPDNGSCPGMERHNAYSARSIVIWKMSMVVQR